MISAKMLELGTKKSTIRTIFEFGQRRAAEVGADNVFDFSLGNPNVPPPAYVNEAIVDILRENDPCAVHGYTIAPGLPGAREAIAADLNRRFGASLAAKNLFMTAGAAAAITITFKALAEPGDEFIAFAPFFPEYRCFVESVGGRLVVVPAQPADFQIDFEAFEKLLGPRTKAVIVNSPNNPSGVVYSEATVQALANVLRRRAKSYGHPIFLIADEPYREIVYEGVTVPYLPACYDDTIVCYSYSKSLSLAGERIGYVAVSDRVTASLRVYGAIAGAARVLTHVNAPSLMQRVVARCAGQPLTHLGAYAANAKLLYDGLVVAGFNCVRPQGAFYLFPQCLEPDDHAFCERAKRFDLLLVPGTDFGCPGHFRAAYCVKRSTIERALPLFQKLAETYK